MLMTEEVQNPFADLLFLIMVDELQFEKSISNALYSVLVEIESPLEQAYFFKEFVTTFGSEEITVN